MIVAGIDMAFSHVGVVLMQCDTDHPEILDLHLITTTPQAGKTVRKSSDELRRAQELVTALRTICARASFAVAEVPSGSQSAQAARALGIAVGVLAACPIPIVEVSPREVKMAAVGTPNATKPEMIAWATKRWPGAPWRSVKRKGAQVLTADNEHLADACAAVVAGMKTPLYQMLRSINGSARPAGVGLAPDQQPQGQLPLGAVPVARTRVPLAPR